MQGKIVLEEHFALEETWRDSVPEAIPAELIAYLRGRLFDFHDHRLREMDAAGIEFAILSLNTPTVQRVLDPKEAIALARRSNDFMAAEIAKRPDRFAGFAALPMQDPDAAAEELTRCVREFGFKGAMVNGFTQKDVPDSAIYYDIPEYRTFWAAVQDLDVPFYLHPRGQIPPRAQAFAGHQWMTGAAWGYAQETALHTTCGGSIDGWPACRSTTRASAR
jgi:predicted TIM-barrel fold metal-dependent hydrolase